MAEQTIRVNVPDGYEVVAIDVPRAGIDYVLCGDDVILAPATVYSRVIVRKVGVSDDTRQLQQLMRLVESEFDRALSDLPENDPWRTRLFCIYESIRIRAGELVDSCSGAKS